MVWNEKKKVMVWMEMTVIFLLEPYFFEGNVNDNSYHEMFVNHCIPQLKAKKVHDSHI